MEDRLQKFKGKDGKNDVEAVKARLSKGFQRGGGGMDFKVSSQMRAAESKRSNRMLLALVIILVVLAYFLFKFTSQLLKRRWGKRVASCGVRVASIQFITFVLLQRT